MSRDTRSTIIDFAGSFVVGYCIGVVLAFVIIAISWLTLIVARGIFG